MKTRLRSLNLARKPALRSVISKLKTNKPLTESDVKQLERILWSEIGSKQDYENEFGDTPLVFDFFEIRANILEPTLTTIGSGPKG